MKKTELNFKIDPRIFENFGKFKKVQMTELTRCSERISKIMSESFKPLQEVMKRIQVPTYGIRVPSHSFQVPDCKIESLTRFDYDYSFFEGTETFPLKKKNPIGYRLPHNEG